MVVQDIATILGVRVVQCHERYLGLPSFMGKNKKNLFAHIKDRVWSRLHGWQGKLFSIAGKEILIKTIIQAIPNYSMSLFKFPKAFIKEFHRACASFWWGSSGNARKVHWGFW
ncbi:hypothetical protein ACOSQ3_023664 [Xanthoceras sorbifolium]